MSKSSTTSAPEPYQLPSKSPDPSVTSPSAPPTHFRRANTLGEDLAFKDGLGAARAPLNASHSGLSVTFRSIDDANAPISSSPAAAPTIKSSGIKTFGSVPANTNGKIHTRTHSFSTGTPSSGAVGASNPSSSSAAPPTSSTASSTAPSTSGAPSGPRVGKFDVKSLFQSKISDASSTQSAASASSQRAHTAWLSSLYSSTPWTPASSDAPGGGNISRLNSNANAFTPKRVVIKSESGKEVDLARFKKQAPGAVLSPIVPSPPARRPVQFRMEAEEAKQKRLAEEAAKKEKKGAEVRANEAEERVKREEERVVGVAEEAAKVKSKAEAEAAVAAAAAEVTKTEPEEGEVQESEQAAVATDEATKEEAKDQVSDKVPLRTDTTGRGIPAALPSALATAQIIEDIGSIQYPEGVQSPKPELNVNAKRGKFRYDRDFLLQFMAVCKEKPDFPHPLDTLAIGLEPVDQSLALTRVGSHPRRSSSTAIPPPSRQASVGLGISGFNKSSVNPFTMGQFSTPTQKLSSEERFAASNQSTSRSGGPAGMPFGHPSTMVRSSGQDVPGHGRTRSKRVKRDKERPGPSVQDHAFEPSSSLAGQQNLEPIAPIELSANRWTPASLTKKGQPVGAETPEVVDSRKGGILLSYVVDAAAV
ncbi:hypothetical protein BD311DRAFT_754942 [Dichomitus squalens]|uniref:Eukaryotic translation initiation factor 4G1 eIF4E-binding domain-containing protein n=1 Tax=Dichomitus squalens TaxID=114155 RepID=A0A4Q9MV90_9APHY|nr:hypothetical protein BD311DRAFT_754942 [Dichomitus squalens]